MNLRFTLSGASSFADPEWELIPLEDLDEDGEPTFSMVEQLLSESSDPIRSGVQPYVEVLSFREDELIDTHRVRPGRSLNVGPHVRRRWLLFHDLRPRLVHLSRDGVCEVNAGALSGTLEREGEEPLPVGAAHGRNILFATPGDIVDLKDTATRYHIRFRTPAVGRPKIAKPPWRPNWVLLVAAFFSMAVHLASAAVVSAGQESWHISPRITPSLPIVVYDIGREKAGTTVDDPFAPGVLSYGDDQTVESFVGVANYSLRLRIHSPAIARVVQGDLGKIAECYNQALERDPKMGGILSVSWRIGTGGRVQKPHIDEEYTTVQSALWRGYYPFNVCITDVMRGWRFPRRQHPTEAGYTFVLGGIVQ